MIPIYRAKKIGSDEFVEGYLKFTKYNNRTEYVINYTYDMATIFGEAQIDPSTLAIHFPDMTDSEGTKIFASLSKDGKGGDILTRWDNHRYVVALWKNHKIILYEQTNKYWTISKKFKVTGIQE